IPGRIGRVVVLQDGPSPSVDIYLRSRLSALDVPLIRYIDMRSRRPDPRELAPDGLGRAFVIVCRYIRSGWLTELERSRSGLAGVAYFADDDLPAMLADGSLPLRYRFKIWRRFARHTRRMSRLASAFWVGTEGLATKYAQNGATLLPPGYVPALSGAGGPVRYFYHGTASHGPEIRFLVDVVTEVQRRNPHAVFEIAGGRDVRDLFRGIDRVIVLHPMNWTTYLAHSSTARQDIGLAPLFPSEVNTSRAPTKVFDITRSGAVGLYSNRAPYSNVIRDGLDGMLLPDRKDAWVEAILGLAADAERRRMMTQAAGAHRQEPGDVLADLIGISRVDAGEVEVISV
ncbi:MAG: hypothetical protein OEY97_11760, partial [Nitrospirota bacterium]|nr:hypothetical protein [Nitrospirota bacterium]